MAERFPFLGHGKCDPIVPVANGWFITRSQIVEAPLLWSRRIQTSLYWGGEHPDVTLTSSHDEPEDVSCYTSLKVSFIRTHSDFVDCNGPDSPSTADVSTPGNSI